MHGPDPRSLHPLPGYPHAVFLKNLIDLPNVEIGDYSYYDDRDGPERFLRNIRYHYGFSGDRLVIGRFCAIAKDVSFIMGDANHALGGLTTYPFAIFRQGWEEALPIERYCLPRKGDTVVGNDVWLGTEATVLPGVTVGDGAVVGAKAVVASDVAPYAVVVGNPVRVVRALRCRHGGAPAEPRLVELAGRTHHPRHPDTGRGRFGRAGSPCGRGAFLSTTAPCARPR